MPNMKGDWDRAPTEENITDVSGGVVSGYDDFILQQNQLSYLQNGILDTVGQRKKRTGAQSMGGPGVYADALCGWNMDNGVRWIAGLWGGEPWLTDGLGGWTLATASMASMYTAITHDLINAREYTYAGAPTSATYSYTVLYAYAIEPYNGVNYERAVSIHEDRSIDYTARCPSAACWFQQRGWIGGLTDSGYYEDTLAWSGIWDMDNFASISVQNIRVDPGRGGRITKIMPARAEKPRLYIFKKSAIYSLDIVWGDGVLIPSTENTLDTANSQITPMSLSVGCVAPLTAVYSSGKTNADIFFLAKDGLRSMARVTGDVAGGAGELVSLPIQDIIDRVNWTKIATAHAVVFDDKLYLCLPVDGSTAPNLCVIYDLKSGIWLGESSFVPKRALVYDLASSQPYLYGVPGTACTDVAFYTTAPSFSSHLYQLQKASWYTDGAYTAVRYREESRGFIFGNYGQLKRWDWVQLMMVPATTAATITVACKVDEQDWQDVKVLSIAPSYVYPILPAPLPWSFTSSKAAFEQINLQDVVPGQKIKIRITSDSPSSFAIRALRITAWPYEGAWE